MAPDRLQAIDPDREPDRGDRIFRAQPRQQRVAASSPQQLAGDARVRIVNLEHEAGVIIDAAPECGRETHARNVDGLRGEKSGAAFQQIDRGPERRAGFLGRAATAS